MGVQAQDTSSGKSTTPPQASWEGTTGRTDVGYTNLTAADAWNKQQAAAPAPAEDPLKKPGWNTEGLTAEAATALQNPATVPWIMRLTGNGEGAYVPGGPQNTNGAGGTGGAGPTFGPTNGPTNGPTFGPTNGGGFGAGAVPSAVDDTSRRRVEEAILSRLEPQFQQDEANLRNKLITSGLEVGSHAYNTELDRLKRSQTDARMQAILAGGTEESRQVGMNSQLQSLAFSQGLQGAQFDNQVRQQMLSELLLQRNTPLNELNSLRTGGQVSMPNFQGYYTNNATPAPIFDAAQSTGNYNMSAWQQQQAGANALLGGLASLGGAGIMRYSDARLKEDIRLIGQTPGGVNLYSWKWKDGSGEDSGVIAQEVALSHPEAVSTDTSGFLMVDYSKLH